MKKHFISALLCLLVPFFYQIPSAYTQAIALTESKVAWRSWHLTNKRGSNFLVKVSGNTLQATDNTISDASTFIIESGPDDSNWTTPDARWFFIRSLSTGLYITVSESGNSPRAVSLSEYNENSHAQQFRLIDAGAPNYKLRSRLSSSGPDLVLETDDNGYLQAAPPVLVPRQNFEFELAMPSGSGRRYSIVNQAKGRFLSDNGIKEDGTNAVQNKHTDESAIWRLDHVEGEWYIIRNDLTQQLMTAPEGADPFTYVDMTAEAHGHRSQWKIERNNATYLISNRAFPNLFLSVNFQVAGDPVLLMGADDLDKRLWIISLMPEDPEILPGDYDRIETGALSNDCLLSYGPNFKRALCERVGLNPAHAELYFDFIREAIAAKMGANRVDEILQKMALDNAGHRVDLVIMVRQYLAEVLVNVSYAQWSPAAQAAVTEWQNKVQALRLDYANRLMTAWNAYVAEHGSNLSFADLFFFWIDGDGFVWPAYYSSNETQALLMRDYASGAATFGEINPAIVGNTALGAAVVTSWMLATSTTLPGYSAVYAAVWSWTSPGVLGGSPFGAIVSFSIFPISVAVVASTSLALQVLDVIQFEDFLDDLEGKLAWASQSIDIPAILTGNNLLDRVRLLADLDYLLGAPTTQSFQYNTNDNIYLQPFSLSCFSNVTLDLSPAGDATLTADQVVSGLIQLCGSEVAYHLSQNQFDCNDLPSAQVTLTAQNDKLTQSCPVTVNLRDNIKPVINCPDPQTLVLAANCSATLPDYRSLATANDNCGLQSVAQSPAPGALVSGAGSMNVTLTVTDINGNANTCTFTVTKVDNTPPTIACPPTQMLVLAANCSANLPDYRSLATANDHCGLQSVTQSPAAGTTVSNTGNIAVTLTATDISGNTNACTFTVAKVDNTPPTTQCFPQTITFNGQTSIALNADDLVDASDNCGVAGISLSSDLITCEQIGQTLPVTVTVTDMNNNASTCASHITVAGLPCGWSQNPDGIACAGGSSNTYNPAAGLWTATSNGCFYGPPYTSDANSFAQRSLCGNGSITAQVTSINGSGWAGIVMREGNAPGARKVQLITNLGALTRREVRYAPDGQAYPQQFPSQNRYWLRILRQGSQFVGFVSANGAAWSQVFALTVSMANCIEIGLIATNNTPTGSAGATFANVSLIGNTHLAAIAAPDLGAETANLNLFPNPTSGEVSVDLAPWAGKPVVIDVYDLQGRRVYRREVDEAAGITPVDISQLPGGVYLFRVGAAQQRVVLQR